MSLANSALNIMKFPLSFQAQGDSDNARLEIVGTGTGCFSRWSRLVNATQTTCKGFRAEVIAALKQLHSGVYRWPGGNFVSGHEWRDAIGDPDKRATNYGSGLACGSAE